MVALSEACQHHVESIYSCCVLSTACRSIFAQELAMCEEMVQMLPEKINQMHFMGKKFVK